MKKYEIEMIKNKTIEELFIEYRFLVKPTIVKYYSRYFTNGNMWIDDVLACAEIGVYKGLINLKMDKVKDEQSIRCAIVWSIRGHVREFEREMFGCEDSEKRKGYYQTISYNKPMTNSNKNGKNFDESFDESSDESFDESLALSINEDKRIEYLDLYAAIEKLSDDERYLVGKVLSGATLDSIGEDKRLGEIGRDKAFRLKKKVLSKLRRKLQAAF